MTLSLSAFSQKIEVHPLDKIEIASEENIFDYEKWLKVSNFLVMKFELNTIGVKHLFEKFNELIKRNNISYDKIKIDKSFLPSYVSSLDDYQILNLAIQNNDAEIHKTWVVDENYLIIKLNKNDYQIVINNK